MANYEEEAFYVRWWFLTLILLMISIGFLTFMGYFGKWLDAGIDRKVMENSHQYREARKTEIVTYEAQLAQLRGQLNRSDLSESDKAGIEGQIASIKILLKAAKDK